MTVSGRCHIWGQGVQLAGGEPQPTKYPSFRTRARRVEGHAEKVDCYSYQAVDFNPVARNTNQ